VSKRPVKFLVRPVAMEMTAQVIMTETRKVGTLTRVRSMFEGIPVMTYPTNRIETHVWYWTSDRPRSSSKEDTGLSGAVIRVEWGTYALPKQWRFGRGNSASTLTITRSTICQHETSDGETSDGYERLAMM
jgi:hypothetical protein